MGEILTREERLRKAHQTRMMDSLVFQERMDDVRAEEEAAALALVEARKRRSQKILMDRVVRGMDDDEPADAPRLGRFASIAGLTPPNRDELIGRIRAEADVERQLTPSNRRSDAVELSNFVEWAYGSHTGSRPSKADMEAVRKRAEAGGSFLSADDAAILLDDDGYDRMVAKKIRDVFGRDLTRGEIRTRGAAFLVADLKSSSGKDTPALRRIGRVRLQALRDSLGRDADKMTDEDRRNARLGLEMLEEEHAKMKAAHKRSDEKSEPNAFEHLILAVGRGVLLSPDTVSGVWDFMGADTSAAMTNESVERSYAQLGGMAKLGLTLAEFTGTMFGINRAATGITASIVKGSGGRLTEAWVMRNLGTPLAMSGYNATAAALAGEDVLGAATTGALTGRLTPVVEDAVVKMFAKANPIVREMLAEGIGDALVQVGIQGEALTMEDLLAGMIYGGARAAPRGSKEFVRNKIKRVEEARQKAAAEAEWLEAENEKRSKEEEAPVVREIVDQSKFDKWLKQKYPVQGVDDVQGPDDVHTVRDVSADSSREIDIFRETDDAPDVGPASKTEPLDPFRASKDAPDIEDGKSLNTDDVVVERVDLSEYDKGAVESYDERFNVEEAPEPGANRKTNSESGFLDLEAGAKMIGRAFTHPRATLRIVENPANVVGGRAITHGVKAVGEAAKWIEKQMGHVPGFNRAADASYRRVIRGAQDWVVAQREFISHDAETSRMMEAAGIEMQQAVVHLSGHTGKDGRRQSYDPTQREHIMSYLEGEGDRDAVVRFVGEDAALAVDATRKIINDAHHVLRQRGLIDQDAYEQYLDSYTRRDFSKNNSLLDHLDRIIRSSDDLVNRRNNLRRDAWVVTWRDPDSKRLKRKKFHDHLHDDPAFAAQVWADEQIRQGKGVEPEVRPPMTKAERVALGEIRDPAVVAARTIGVQQMALSISRLQELTAKSDLLSGDEHHDGLHKKAVPDDPAYGALAGKYVHKAIYREIMGRFAESGSSIRHMLVMLDAQTTQWKIGQTILNPGTHARNWLANHFFGEFAGISAFSAEDWPDFRDAISMLRSKKGSNEFEKLKELVLSGVANGDVMSIELGAVIGMADNDAGGAFAQWRRNAWDRLSQGRYAEAVPGFDVARRMFQAEDVAHKIATYLKARRSKSHKRPGLGMSHADAVAHVAKWYPSYDSSPMQMILSHKSNVGLLNRGSWAPPFMTFTVESSRILMNAIAEKPATVGLQLWGLQQMSTLSAAILGLSDEDMENMDRYAPPWMRTSALNPLIPIRDSEGRVQNLDMRHIYPVTFAMNVLGLVDTGEEGDGRLAGAQAELINNPLMRAAMVLFGRNVDSFGNKIWRDDGSMLPSEIESAKRAWLWSNLTPAMTPVVGRKAKQIQKMITGEPINRSGDKITLWDSVLDNFFGMKLRSRRPERDEFVHALRQGDAAQRLYLDKLDDDERPRAEKFMRIRNLQRVRARANRDGDMRKVREADREMARISDTIR